MTTGNEEYNRDKPTWRMPFGTLLILFLVLLWSGMVVTLVDWISAFNIWLQLPIYIVAGTIWIFPIKPILVWMNTGKWRHPDISGNGASDET